MRRETRSLPKLLGNNVDGVRTIRFHRKRSLRWRKLYSATTFESSAPLASAAPQEQVHVDPEDFTAQVACGARQIARTIRFRSHGGFCRRKIIEENKIREFQCRMNSSFDMRTNVWKSYQTLRLRVVAQFEDDATKKTNSPRPPR